MMRQPLVEQIESQSAVAVIHQASSTSITLRMTKVCIVNAMRLNASSTNSIVVGICVRALMTKPHAILVFYTLSQP